MEIDKLTPAEKRALLERLLTKDTRPKRLEELRAVKALYSRLEVVSRWTRQNPFFKVHQGITRDTARIGGRELINFSTYNYLGLSGDPRVSAAAKEAIDRYGTSPSASRIASGEKEVHKELEGELAAWLGTEAAIVMVSGHATNVTVLGHLLGKDDLILADALAHNSILEGAKLSGARFRLYRHNDLAHLDALLAEHRKDTQVALIVTEGVFSMDGDLPDLPGLIALKKKHGAFLMVDEAHSLGVLGKGGRGAAEHFGVDPKDVELWMGTLSKSLASCGGYIAGSAAFVEFLKYTAPGFVYSVGITPPNAAAALAAIRIIREDPSLVARLQENCRFFLSEARGAGLDTHLASGAAVIPVVTGSSFRAVRLAEALFARGINVDPVISPAVEQDKARLRFFITATHTEEEMRAAVRAVAEEIERLPSRTTVIGEILATLPSKDRGDLPSGHIRDPGTVFHRHARLSEPRYDPVKEDQNAVVARGVYRRLAAEGEIDRSAFAPSCVAEVPGVSGQAAAGRWRGEGAFEEMIRHQQRVRPSLGWTVDYVMAWADEVLVAGKRTLPSGDEWYLHLLGMEGGKITRVEDILDGGAWAGEGAPGPEAGLVAVPHDTAAAQENLRITRELYDAFVKKADVEKFIANCAPDLCWEVAGPKELPFVGTWRGPDGWLGFWKDLASIMDIHEVWIDAAIARGDKVYSLGGFRSTAILTALAYSDPFLQVATYKGGKLVHFVDYFDPRIDLAAFRPDVYVDGG